jgi:hypothetical protein
MTGCLKNIPEHVNWWEEGNLKMFWERLSYLCCASTIVDHVTKVVRVWQECKTRIRFDIWVTSAYVDLGELSGCLVA